ncbi:type IV pilus modification PilV family protein [Sphingomonas sp. 8AM]|uniref:type IV pilus modification PilV family protein n=1 Tax=Sphingomonas sp. 8AM TaxID=2653170 RepID=UPI0012F0969B|nr:type II secretion system protein [Sphingomonas sp. 8AM]VXD01407.1 conserved hypothetical protein [Sphingomonas sp. 8AM]
MSRRAQTGFSLLECLVALTVIATMAAIMMQVIASNARATRDLAEKRMAILLAHSLLAQSVMLRGTARARDEGRFGVLAWRIDRRAAPGDAAAAVPLEEVEVSVADHHSGRWLTRVNTLRLVR